VIVGELRGYDQLQNLILCNSHERVFSTDAPVELVPLGLYVIRGDNIVLIYEIDENLDSKLDLNTLRAKPLKHVAQYVLWPVGRCRDKTVVGNERSMLT